LGADATSKLVFKLNLLIITFGDKFGSYFAGLGVPLEVLGRRLFGPLGAVLGGITSEKI
jgi:hypothetical protein